jgi:signal transduction histidine kinase/HAMP domain-containing protein
MSLKTRLQLSIIALNLGLVLLYSLMHVYSIAEVRQQNFAERASGVADQVQSFVQERVNAITEQSTELPSNPAELNVFYHQAAREDQRIQGMLESVFASTKVLSRILILDNEDRILVSSNILDVTGLESPSGEVVLLEEFLQRGSLSRMLTIFNETQEIAIERSLGSGEEKVFSIRVVLSSLLLRDAVMEQLRYLLPLSVFAFLLAIVLAVFVSNLATRQLRRVSEAIDRIAAGEQQKLLPAPTNTGFKEYDIVQSKLEMLGQQIRGAKQDARSMQEGVRQLLARTEKAVMLFDASDCLVSAGENTELILNRSRFELIGKRSGDIFPPSTKLGALIVRAVTLKTSVKDQLVLVDRDGLPPVKAFVTVEPMDQFSSWERVGTLVTLRDAESHAVIQSQLDVSTRLSAISRLTSGVAHEIKNPLNAMNLHLEVLKTHLPEGQENAQKSVGVIAAEITRLNRVVNTFLDFTRPVDLNLENLNLADLVSDTGKLFAPQADAKGAQLVVVHPPAPIFVRGDRDLLKQALLNVTANALEAIGEQGRVEVELSRETDDCILRVTDNGEGIPTEIQDKIFQLYFSTKGKGRGTGIGLAMTFRIVQLHNGAIWFESEPGKGTSFWIRLPLAGNRMLANETELANASPGTQQHTEAEREQSARPLPQSERPPREEAIPQKEGNS